MQINGHETDKAKHRSTHSNKQHNQETDMQKAPNTSKITGAAMKRLREKLALNQTAFWSPIGVTQSGASRYESGRSIPAPTRNAIAFIYADEIKRHARALRA